MKTFNTKKVDWIISSGTSRPSGLTCLAQGADQAFAETILSLGGSLLAVIPHSSYRQSFTHKADLENFNSLAKKAQVVQLSDGVTQEESYMNAGRYIVDHSDLMFFVWDQKKAAGYGGTGDVVEYAKSRRLRMIIFNPISRTVHEV